MKLLAMAATAAILTRIAHQHGYVLGFEAGSRQMREAFEAQLRARRS